MHCLPHVIPYIPMSSQSFKCLSPLFQHLPNILGFDSRLAHPKTFCPILFPRFQGSFKFTTTSSILPPPGPSLGPLPSTRHYLPHRICTILPLSFRAPSAPPACPSALRFYKIFFQNLASPKSPPFFLLSYFLSLLLFGYLLLRHVGSTLRAKGLKNLLFPTCLSQTNVVRPYRTHSRPLVVKVYRGAY